LASATLPPTITIGLCRLPQRLPQPPITRNLCDTSEVRRLLDHAHRSRGITRDAA
jgi:hypothetical protein